MDSVGQGIVTGGWGYVWATYGLSWGAILFYTATVLLRERKLAGGDK